MRMLLSKERNAEPIAGYRLLEPLGCGGFGEVWKCEAPGGLFKAIKFVAGHGDDLNSDPAPAAEELKAIQHIKALRHPFLLSMERVELIGKELVIVMELADRSLMDLYNERRSAGRPGIDRADLLRYLREAADVLDLMNQRYGLQHLDIKPANLFLVSDHVKVADFGLVRSVAERGAGDGVALGALTALYAAPELYRNAVSPNSDQYSLAIVYQELLTGTLPFSGKNTRQLMLKHCTAEPDLAALPDADRPVVKRALSKAPGQRFASCSDFVQALEDSMARHGTAAPGPALAVGADTKIGASATTPARPANAGCLPGHRFLLCQGRTPFAEVWEAHSPDGQRQLVKFLFGVLGRDPAREEEAVRRLGALRHPVLSYMRFLPGGPGCLVVVTDFVKETLRDRAQAVRGSVANGSGRSLPRPLLLGWLRTVAEALDQLARETGLHHLCLTPRHIVLADDRPRIADFGLADLLWRPAGQLQGQLQARYAAPELFGGAQGERSDQYSLAAIYQEMLTGVPPWRGRRGGPPNLQPLPRADQAVVRRALEEDPVRRFASGTDFIAALEDAGEPNSAGSRPSRGRADSKTILTQGKAAAVAELLIEAGGSAVLTRPEMWGKTATGALQLQHRFAARLPDTAVATAFEPFARQWNAQQLRQAEQALVFQVSLPGSFWQRWLGGTPALLVDLEWASSGTGTPELTVRIRADEKGGKVEDALLREVAPLMLDCLRTHLEAFPERRRRRRLAWTHPVRAAFVLADGQLGEVLDGAGKDLSLTGMGLYLPHATQGAKVVLELNTPTRSEPVTLEGTCLRVQRCTDGRHLVGVAFR
jgi:serine/threonine protein kinase